MHSNNIVEIFEDIKQFFVFAQPCKQLSGYIEFFAESSYENIIQRRNGQQISYKMFPSYTPTFFINLTGPYLLRLDNQNFLIEEQQDIMILRDTSVVRFNSINDNIFTVKFHPGALEQLLGASSANTKASIKFLNTLLPNQLLSDIRNAVNFENRVSIISDYLLKKCIDKHDYKLCMVYDAIRRFKENEIHISNEEIAKQLNISSKTLNRYFANKIGVTPKKYFSMVRFRMALTNYINRNETFHPYDYGYYDYSHFGKDVARFTGRH